MIKEMQTLGMKLVEISKDIKLTELAKQGRVYLWIDGKKKEQGMIINNKKLIKVGENEKNYLYQEMR